MHDRQASLGAAVACRTPLLLLVAALLPACETTLVTPVAIDRVEVVPSTITLTEGDRETVSAILTEKKGEVLSGARVTWSIDDPEVASITSDGVIEALSAGRTSIRASLGDASGTAELSVLLGPTLRLSPDRVSFEATSGDVEPEVAVVNIENAGAGALEGLSVHVEGSGGAAASWLTAELLASAAPTKLQIRAEPGGLEPGVHEALLVVASSATGEPARIDVRLRVHARDQGPACEIRSNVISGDLRIPADTRCVLSDVYVGGHLRLDAGASITGDELTVVGNVEGKHAEELTLTEAVILGDLRFEGGGSVSLRASQFEGKLELKSNVGAIELQDNVIHDDVKLEKNRVGPFRLVGNTIDGKLECKENDPAPVGSGNVADEMTRQCSGL